MVAMTGAWNSFCGLGFAAKSAIAFLASVAVGLSIGLAEGAVGLPSLPVGLAASVALLAVLACADRKTAS